MGILGLRDRQGPGIFSALRRVNQSRQMPWEGGSLLNQYNI